jgi:hypothetical protein
MTKRDRYAQQLGQEPELAPMPTQADIFYPAPAPIPPRRSAGGLALKDGEVQIGAFKITGTGLEIGQHATQEEWSKVGELLFKLEGSIQWLIGDWLAYGEDVKWGETAIIAEQLGRKTKTLTEYAYVARNVKLSIRMDNLSFGHHQLVASLTPQEQSDALTYAAQHNLSVAAFRKELQGQPSTLSGGLDTDKSYNAMKKLMQRDPTIAKAQDHEDARRVYREMQEVIKAFGKQWGIE